MKATFIKGISCYYQRILPEICNLKKENKDKFSKMLYSQQET